MRSRQRRLRGRQRDIGSQASSPADSTTTDPPETRLTWTGERITIRRDGYVDSAARDHQGSEPADERDQGFERDQGCVCARAAAARVVGETEPPAEPRA